MKKLFIFTLLFCFAFSLNAQVKTPQPSPVSKIEQKVGLTDFTIEYSRPSVKDRIIFGELVAYDEIWRTGANKNTTITFSDPITLEEGRQIKAGTYAIYTIPGKEIWSIIIYNETENWGVPKDWDQNKIVGAAKVVPSKLPFSVETFTIDINNISNGGASLDIMWDKTYISVPFTVPTDDKVLESINDALNGKPTAQDYYAAAVYYYQEKKDIRDAKKWIDKSMDMTESPAFWQLRQQSLIYARFGDVDGAVRLAEQSLEGAKAAGNQQYVQFNEKSLAEWRVKKEAMSKD